MVTFECEAGNGTPPICDQGLMDVFQLPDQSTPTGQTSFTVTGSLFEMTAPFSLLNTLNGDFTYSIEDGTFNTVGQVLFGTSGQDYVVADIPSAISTIPIPAAIWLFGTALVGMF